MVHCNHTTPCNCGGSHVLNAGAARDSSGEACNAHVAAFELASYSVEKLVFGDLLTLHCQKLDPLELFPVLCVALCGAFRPKQRDSPCV